VALAAAIAFVVTRTQSHEERVVFVDAQKSADAEDQAEPAPPEHVPQPAALPQPTQETPQAAETPSPSSEASLAPPLKKRSAQDESFGLTRAFGTRRREIEVCFTEHSALLEGAPRLHVDFEIATDGSVTRAHLDPEAIEQTELGRCVLKVARATQFGKQPASLRFRIPLTARNQ
jgi:hypothetical protein